LPQGFSETTRRQYTAALALQELEGQFVDAEGTLFRREWFSVIDKAPPVVAVVRGWDMAATEVRPGTDPDWTAGVLLAKDSQGGLYVLDLKRVRGSPQTVQQLVLATAVGDGRAVPVVMEQEPGSAGKIVTDTYLRALTGAGYAFHAKRSTGSKVDRATPLAAAAEGGLVKLLRGPWNKDWLDEVELFPNGAHDDAVDATTLAAGFLAWRSSTYSSGPVALTAGYAPPFGAVAPAAPGKLGAQGYGREGDGYGPLTTGHGGDVFPGEWYGHK
jgi:predicted phage terminase large subunit-like protein